MPKLKATMLDRLISRFEVSGLVDCQSELSNWLTKPLGANLYAAEALSCSPDAIEIPGYRAMQLGISPAHGLLAGFKHKHKFVLASKPAEGAACVCDYGALPLPSNTLDVVLLHHALDFSPEPHQLLNESARVVTAGGYIFIVGFDPFSAFGVAKWFACFFTGKPVWRHNSLRKARLIDWLQLIGFQIVIRERSKEEIPEQQEKGSFFRRIFERGRRRVASGAFYVVVARKQATPLSPIRHTLWQPVKIPRLAGLKPLSKGELEEE